ncbi:uncharacterized protein LOC100209216 [Hydra vulgaris]|uniref:uncharacterized protein LOC100209216 n=1 Tax=Hydra vulgaris TaxID=6087 RepID=UPI001F5F1B7B|nr:uncharacterized protein LOC100209216 [Hydra vulgaris]
MMLRIGCNKINLFYNKPCAIHRLFLTSRYTTHEILPKKVTFADKFKSVWNGPNFKYWFLGTTFFFSWMTYYGIKTYKKTRINVELLPPLPVHPLVKRTYEMEQLHSKVSTQSSLLGGENIKVVMVLGPPATGKTVLVRDFVKSVIEKQEGFKFSLPKSHVSVFLQADNEDAFLNSLKAFASSLKIKPSDLDNKIHELSLSRTFNLSSFSEQCDALLCCIQEILFKHAGWVLAIDNLQPNTPNSVFSVINKWFIGKESNNWSMGTVVLIYDAVNCFAMNFPESKKYFMEKGFYENDWFQALKIVSGLDATLQMSASFERLAAVLKKNPLAIMCAGFLLRERLSLKEIRSIDTVVTELCSEIEEKVIEVKENNKFMSQFIESELGTTLVVTETIVAMTLKLLLRDDNYLNHGIDLIASLKPNTPVPQSLLTRHLLNSFYKLPILSKASYGLADVFSRQRAELVKQESALNELVDNGKAWSNKNLAEYMRRVKDFVLTGFETIKMIYNLLYGVLPDLPEKDDGLGMFRSFPLLMTQTVEPGGVKTISMHPVVYNVARQHFLSATVHRMECEHILESELTYKNQSWYKKLNGFSKQASIHLFRNSAGVYDGDISFAQSILNKYNFGIDISSIFKTITVMAKDELFWVPTDKELARYLQGHLARALSSINEEILVSKQDTGGLTSRKLLLCHLKYIMENQKMDVIGRKGYAECLSSLANCLALINEDFESSKQILQQVLDLQESSQETNSLDIAKTMTDIAKMQQSLQQFDEAKDVLEKAAQLYEADRRKFGEYKKPSDYGRLLGLLGVTYSALDMKRESKESIERSLMMLQAITPDLSDEAKSKQFGAEFASALTDLGHAYTLMGLPLYGKKILDLSLAALRNIHGTDNHPEIVRALTVLSVAHLMQGHNEESKKLRNEAGKIQTAINALPLY